LFGAGYQDDIALTSAFLARHRAWGDRPLPENPMYNLKPDALHLRCPLRAEPARSKCHKDATAVGGNGSRRRCYRTLTKSADRRRSVCSACRELISRGPWQIRSFRSPSVQPVSASSSAFLPVMRHAPICPTFVAARKTERGAPIIELGYGAVGRRCAVFARADIRKRNIRGD
jgi:hypothetical protein